MLRAFFGRSALSRPVLTRQSPLFRFVTGVLLALLVHGGFSYSKAAAADPPVCALLPTTTDPAQRHFLEMHCRLERDLFGDDLAPSSGFRFEKTPSANGEYEGIDCYGRPVKLEAAKVVKVPVRKQSPEVFDEDDESYFVIGWLSGTTGRVPIAVATLKRAALTGNADLNLVFPVAVLTEAEVARAGHTERIAAGVRVVNPATGQSRPLASMRGSVSLFGFPSDLSTLYGEEVPEEQPHQDASCIALAYKRYNIAQIAAQKNLALCVELQMKAFVICMAVCTAGLYIPTPLTAAGFTLCAIACVAYEAYQTKGCLDAYKIAEEQNLANLLLDLEACGVHVTPT